MHPWKLHNPEQDLKEKTPLILIPEVISDPLFLSDKAGKSITKEKSEHTEDSQLEREISDWFCKVSDN